MMRERSDGSDPRRFDYTFVDRNLPAGSGMSIGRVSLKCAATIWALVFGGLFLNPPAALAQKKNKPPQRYRCGRRNVALREESRRAAGSRA